MKLALDICMHGKGVATELMFGFGAAPNGRGLQAGVEARIGPGDSAEAGSKTALSSRDWKHRQRLPLWRRRGRLRTPVRNRPGFNQGIALQNRCRRRRHGILVQIQHDLGQGRGFRWKRRPRLLLLLFRPAYDPAQGAGAAGLKGLFHGRAQRHRFGIVQRHASPGNDLQNVPMRAGGRKPGNHKERGLQFQPPGNPPLRHRIRCRPPTPRQGRQADRKVEGPTRAARPAGLETWFLIQDRHGSGFRICA